jgi:hypothetical protein
MRLAVLTGATALGLIIAEGLLWIVAPIPYHEWIVWEDEAHIRARPMPNQIIHTAKGFPVRINKYGFRGPDHSYEKSPGTLRIAVFSGSAGFCFEASNDEATWPVTVGRDLEKAFDIPVEVVNLSLPGFDSFHSKINYQCFGRAFGPDAIIVYHTWNDMKMFRSLETVPYRSGGSWIPAKPLWQRIARNTQLGRHGRNVYWKLTDTAMENKYEADEDFKAKVERPISDNAFNWERRNFQDFAVLAKSDGVLPILVSQGTLVVNEALEDDKTRRLLATRVDWVGMSLPLIAETWERVSEMIEDVAREEGAVFVDGYHAVPHDLEHVEDEVHLTDKGNAAVAHEISRVLIQDERVQGLVAEVRAETTPDNGPSGPSR